MLNPAEGIGLFTDGSCWTGDRVGGWAYCAIDAFGGEETGVGSIPDTTNNRMEIQAWIEGMQAMWLACGPCDILVYSDSQYVGLGTMDPSRSRKNNRDLWTNIDRLVRLHKSIEFIHVYGHRDSYYNNLVDDLAGKARRGNV